MAWETVGVLKKCLQNAETYTALNVGEGIELLHEESEIENYNLSLILKYIDFKGRFRMYSKELWGVSQSPLKYPQWGSPF